MKLPFIALALLLAVGIAIAGDLPDARMTPGAIDPSVTQANIRQTVCVKGYTKTVRPPAYFTNALKKRQTRAYGYADRNPKDYEEDHLIALSIGGHPTDERVSCQERCHFSQAAIFRRTVSSRTGLSHMTSGRSQLRVAPDQRSGCARLA